MTLTELERWLRARPGVLLNLGIDDDPHSRFLAWLSWTENGRQLEMPWRVDVYQGADPLGAALSALTAAYEKRQAER